MVSRMGESLIHKRRRKILVILFCILAVILSGLRPIENLKDDGNDTIRYQYSYNEIAGNSWSSLIDQLTFSTTEYEGREGGYALLVKATQLICNDFRFFMFLTAAIFIIPLGRLIHNYVRTTEGLLLSFLIYFALFTSIVNGLMRQAVVLGFFVYSLKYVKTRNWIAYYTILALLLTVHSSIVIAIPFYFMYRLCTSRKWLLIALVAAPFLMAASGLLISRLFVGTLYEHYGEGEGFGLVNLLLLIGLFSILVYFCYDRIKRINNYEYLICGVVGTLLCLPFIRIGGTVLRISYYYFLFFIPLIPVVLDCWCNNKEKRRIAYCISICLFLFLILR